MAEHASFANYVLGSKDRLKYFHDVLESANEEELHELLRPVADKILNKHAPKETEMLEIMYSAANEEWDDGKVTARIKPWLKYINIQSKGKLEKKVIGLITSLGPGIMLRLGPKTSFWRSAPNVSIKKVAKKHTLEHSITPKDHTFVTVAFLKFHNWSLTKSTEIEESGSLIGTIKKYVDWPGIWKEREEEIRLELRNIEASDTRPEEAGTEEVILTSPSCLLINAYNLDELATYSFVDGI